MDRRMIKTILLGLVGFFLAGAISDSNAAFAGCGPFCGGKWKVIAVEHSNVKIPARTLTRAVNNFDYLDAATPTTSYETSNGAISVMCAATVIPCEVCSGDYGALEEAGVSLDANAGLPQTYYLDEGAPVVDSSCRAYQVVQYLSYRVSHYLLGCTCGSKATTNCCVKKFDGHQADVQYGYPSAQLTSDEPARSSDRSANDRLVQKAVSPDGVFRPRRNLLGRR